MTSPSLKNRPTTAQPKAIRSNTRSFWKQCLAGALCLFVTGAIPANDREVGKPLDRLKQRSARQRWRELRGEWVPAPDLESQTQPQPAPNPVVPPFSSPVRNSALPIPTEAPAAVEGAATDEPWVASPVPGPVDLIPDVEREAFTRPGAKPAADPAEPIPHEGSFGDVPLETRIGTPRDRKDIPLPHWPFEDDLDRVGQTDADEADDSLIESPSAVPVPATSVAEDAASSETSEQLPLSFPIQVAEAPTPDAPAATEAPTPDAAVTDSPPETDTAKESPDPQTDDAVASKPVPELDTLQQLKSIRDIQPFYDYMPNGGDPNEILCPRPSSADLNKTYKQCPVESELMTHGNLERNSSIIPVYWQASNVSHNPLYFEDSGLERNGHTFSDAVQPFVSVGKFGAQIVALPYSIALDPVWKNETPLGHYRPGECAPKRHLAVPINGRAAAVAAAAYTGIIYLIP